MYKRKTYTCGPYIEIVKYHRAGRCGTRGKRESVSTAAMIAYNQRRRIRHLQRIIMANFRPGDFHLTLSYQMDRRPETMAEAKKRISAFCRKMKKALEKAGKQFRAIWVTERGKKGACHHHLIVEKLPGMMELVSRLWTDGHADYKPLYADGAFGKLAEYFVKKETKEENTGCSYSHTRNLIIPQPKIEMIRATGWKAVPKPGKGYELLTDTLENGENLITGTPYQRYIVRRIEGEEQRWSESR